MYETAKGDDITVDMVTSEFKSEFPDEDIDEVFGRDSEYNYVKKVIGAKCNSC